MIHYSQKCVKIDGHHRKSDIQFHLLRRRKILNARRHIVITYPLALGVPGGGTIDCIETASHLSAAGADVTLVTISAVPQSHIRVPRPKPSEILSGQDLEAKLRDKSVTVIRIDPNPFHPLFDGLQTKRAIAALLRTKSIDMVLSYWQEAAFLGNFLHSRDVLFGMIAAAPYSFWWNPRPGVTDLFREKRGLRSTSSFLSSLLYRSVFRNKLARGMQNFKRYIFFGKPLTQADIIFARSAYTKKELLSMFKISDDRVVVTYCGVDPLFIQGPRLAHKTVSQFIFHGALTREKGIFDALRAFGDVAALGCRDWIFKVAGWGDEAPLHRVVSELGIANQVVFLGHLSKAELAHELQSAHIAIIPSYAESFGLAIAEAQAAGVPVIAYDVAAVPEVVQNHVTGWLVGTGRVDLLTDAVLQAIEDPSRAFHMGVAARNRVSSLFSWRKSAEHMLEEIEKRKGADASRSGRQGSTFNRGVQ